MPTITIKAKEQTAKYADGTLYQRFIRLPKTLERKHCDMGAFRTHPRFGNYANSDLFPAILARELSQRGIGDRLVLEDSSGIHSLPAGVTVATGFLSTVTIDLN